MIRRSIVLKLWLTIVAMVLVVLAIVALYLEQFFATYVNKIQRRELTNQVLLVNELLNKEPLDDVMLQIGTRVSSPLHNHYYLVKPPARDATVNRWLNSLSPKERSSLQAGAPYIGQGAPSFLRRPDPSTNLYAVIAQMDPNSGVDEALLVITESGQFVGTPANSISGLIIFAVILGTLLTTGLAFVVSKNLANPVLEMNSVAEEMAKGRFDLRVRVVTQDEVGRLGNTLNHVAADLEQSVRALTLEKEEVAGLLEAMTDAVVAADLHGTATLLNPAARAWLANYPSEGVLDVGQLPDDLRQLHHDTLQRRQWMQRELEVGDRAMIATVTPLYEPDDSGQLRGTLAVVRDVTQERRLERLRKDFVANVSHELRTPLSMLQGYTEALLDDFGTDPAERTELTNIIYEETLRMRRLVNELLDLAQLESGHFSMHFAILDAELVIEKVARKFQGLFHERGLYLHVDAQVPHALIFGDQDRLEQVLTNLVDNAFRHTTQGGVTLSLREESATVLMAVSDTGHGIGKDDLPYVFERFYKVDKARTRAKGGTGLGLSIANNLIHAHQGKIDVYSDVDVGTTFTIYLPKIDA